MENVTTRFYEFENTGSNVEMRELDDGSFYISDVWTPEENRNQGGARRVMEMVCEDADKQQITLRLHTEPRAPSVDHDRLSDFYCSSGFERSVDPNDASKILYTRKSRKPN